MTKVDDEKMIGLNVRMLRERAEMSQADLVAAVQAADMTHFHQTTLSRVEAGTRPLRLSEAIVIAAVLGIPTAELYESHTDHDRAASQNLAVATASVLDLREVARRIGDIQVQLGVAIRLGVSDPIQQRIQSERLELGDILAVVEDGYDDGRSSADAYVKSIEVKNG